MTLKIVKDAVTNKVAAVTTAVATGGTSTASLFGFIPADVSKLGILLGAILSFTLIISHISKGIMDYRISKLEIERLEIELELDKSEDKERRE